MIDKPIAGVTTVARPHPAGGVGARLSLKEVAERSWKARMSPRLNAWVKQALAKHKASTGGKREKAKAILTEWRLKVPYIADPVMGEFMATPDQILCLDDGGLCIIGSDCDEHAIGLAASMMSIGILAMIIGSSHREPYDVPTHVYMAFEDDMGEWVRMDGTTNLPVGRAAPYAREFWYEPGAEAKEKGEGDFVGMAGVGVGGSSSTSATLIDLLYPNLR